MPKKSFAFMKSTNSSQTGSKSKDLVDQMNNKDIAIIGIASRLPTAENYAEFWRMLSAEACCVGPISEIREEDATNYLNFSRHTEQQYRFLEGAFLDNVDYFDYGLFRITPVEAGMMNPNQRIFLETAWECIEDAGYGGDKIKGTNTGVYVGYIADSEGSQYRQMIMDAKLQYHAAGVTGNLASIIPGRISYLLDLKGPSMLVDTACSSSLSAVHLACNAIRNGDCSMALAGGVRTSLLPLEQQVKIGIEASDGRTRPFDDRADGTGLGEGAAVVLLKPLNEAMKDRDHIHAIIKGSAMNQDGNSIGITAPNVKAQTEVIEKAWRNAGIDPETISYIETHGTGTRLGDPVEIEGISSAFQRYTGNKQFCGVGSLKSNIGHLYDCAGIAGLIKLVLSLKHRVLPASIHFRSPNAHINFIDSPLYVVSRKKNWDKPYPLRAGISSFGFSGTNCHLVVEEAPCQADISFVKSSEVFTLSAISITALTHYISRYADFLTEHEDMDLGNLCYTANTGRAPFPFRIAIVTSDINELKKHLNALLRGDYTQYLNGAGPIRFGYGASKGGLSDSCCHTPDEAATAFTGGKIINWRHYYKQEQRFKVPLPTYPFEKLRCWIDIPADGVESPLSRDNCELEGREKGDVQYTDLEKALARIWSEELGFKTVNIHQPFYDMGGDSILATKIVNRLNLSGFPETTISDILKLQTVYQLAQSYERKELVQAPNIYTISPLPEEDFYPVASAQKRIYILQQMQAGSTTYNMPFSIRIEGKLDYEKFLNALQLLVERHEAFRTSFHELDGEIVQRISKAETLDFQAQPTVMSELPDLIRRFISPFSLDRSPLMRVRLYQVGEALNVLLIDMHHIISDGTSLAVMLQDFSHLYSGAELKPLAVQYKDYAAWYKGFLDSDNLVSMRTYWMNQFDNLPSLLHLPTDYLRPLHKGTEGCTLEFTAEDDLFTNINRLSLNTETTLFMVLLTAYYLLLHKYSGQEDIVVGSPISGRRSADTERIVGMFVNMLALRNAPQQEKTVAGFIAEVKNSTLSAFNHQDVQFEDLVERLGIPRRTDRHPLFDVVFALQDGSMISAEMNGLQLTPSSINTNSKFDLTLQTFPQENGLLFTFEYDSHLFREETVTRMAEDYILLLDQMTRNPSQQIKDLHIQQTTSLEMANPFLEMNFDF